VITIFWSIFKSSLIKFFKKIFYYDTHGASYFIKITLYGYLGLSFFVLVTSRWNILGIICEFHEVEAETNVHVAQEKVIIYFNKKTYQKINMQRTYIYLQLTNTVGDVIGAWQNANNEVHSKLQAFV